ncbi:MAG TPA: ABC transporter substrate-binding protein [Candidatus Stackebrandtia faecavium]|nr:ABC transporter substrate-binding protein [Candidatus Stackebrandtia faecavium]
MSQNAKRLALPALLLVLPLALIGCGSGADAEKASDEAVATTNAEVPSVDAQDPQLPVEFTGDDDVDVEVSSLDRVLVLDDATMEIMDALSMADYVGIAPETSLIEDVAANADERITTAGRGSLTVEGVVALDPTLVIGTSMRRHADVIAGLQDAGIPATLIDGTQQAPDKITKTATLLGVPEAGEELASEVQEQFDEAESKLTGVEERPRVMILSSQGAGDSGNTTAAGKATPAHQVIEQAGGLNTGAETGLDRYQAITAEGLIAAGPETIVVAESELDDLGGEDGIWEQVKGLNGTPAAKSKSLIVIDDMQLKGGGISAGVGILNLQTQLHPDS